MVSGTIAQLLLYQYLVENEVEYSFIKFIHYILTISNHEVFKPHLGNFILSWGDSCIGPGYR